MLSLGVKYQSLSEYKNKTCQNCKGALIINQQGGPMKITYEDCRFCKGYGVMGMLMCKPCRGKGQIAVAIWDKCKNCGAALVGTTKCTECEEEND